MHQHAMVLYKKSQSSGDVSAYIAKALTPLDARTEERVRKKFEIVYLLVKENLLFIKMSPFCQLVEKHRFGLGARYKNDQAHATCYAL